MAPLPDLEEFRHAARAWLSERVAPREGESTAWGVGSDSVAVFHDRSDDDELQAVKNACEWHRTKLDAGWALLSWPEIYGGRGLPVAYERAFAAEEAGFEISAVPELVTITLSLVAPTIDAFGTDHQKRELLPPFLSTDRLSCQLFSEPNAGSDLASLSCRAIRSGSTWIVSGQKVWTSGAKQADYGLLIARSDPTAAKHRGMTAFLVPLDADGVEIRPIRQMTGGASFNEVFLNDVELGDDMRLGAEGDGWSVTLAMLGFERSVSGDGAGGVGGSWTDVARLARHVGATVDPVKRQRLMHLYSRVRILDLINERTRGALASGEEPGVLGSIAKLFWVQNMTEMSDVVSTLLGPALAANTGEWGIYAWAEHVLGAPGYRIAGGSDEIQRNIIGERVLGLPREPIVDPARGQ
jgi:alkylation response protein AidB-like acyl-CoA dehydrogenase